MLTRTQQQQVTKERCNQLAAVHDSSILPIRSNYRSSFEANKPKRKRSFSLSLTHIHKIFCNEIKNAELYLMPTNNKHSIFSLHWSPPFHRAQQIYMYASPCTYLQAYLDYITVKQHTHTHTSTSQTHKSNEDYCMYRNIVPETR